MGAEVETVLAHNGLLRSQFGKTLESRFRRYLGNPAPNGCIEWCGTKTKKGYGVLRLASTGVPKTTAHRIAWVLRYGDLEAAALMLHRCDNPSCVNTEHLFIGSAKQNTEDMVAKGRHPWREKTPWQKLTVESDKLIRKLRADGFTQQKVAEILGVSRPRISLVEHGKVQHAASACA